jgi:hypothetical protein
MSTDVAEILSRFPGPVTLRPARTKWLLVFAIGILFAAGGMWMIEDDRLMGWYVLVFFGLTALVAAVAMLPGAGVLALDREGFEVTSLFRRHRIRWRDTTDFAAVRIPPARQSMVAYNDLKQSGSRLAKMNVAIVGRTAAIPDTYGLSADALAQLMAQWRERALA